MASLTHIFLKIRTYVKILSTFPFLGLLLISTGKLFAIEKNFSLKFLRKFTDHRRENVGVRDPFKFPDFYKNLRDC